MNIRRVCLRAVPDEIIYALSLAPRFPVYLAAMGQHLPNSDVSAMSAIASTSVVSMIAI
jgi:hypothetical protein